MEGSEDRTALKGMEKRLFELVWKGATSAQWAEWLRVPLEHAVAKGDKNLALSLLKAGAGGGAGWNGCDGRTLLDAAAEGGNCEVVSTLLDAGGLADLNAVSGDKKMTALHRAIAGGHTDVARALMLAGADVSLLDSRDRSALHYAVEGGHLQLAGNVILTGADHNAADTDGDTPLHLAAAHDDDKFVCTLLRKGAGVKVANNKGQSPLHLAVEHGHITVAEALLKAGADPNVRYGNHKNVAPLQLARSSVAMTQTLLNHGADVKTSDTRGYTALHRCYQPDVIDTLVEAGADLEARTSRSTTYYDGRYSFKGLTSLHHATLRPKFKGMVALLRKGANINAKDDKALTPLHIVCKTSAEVRSTKAADLLLRWGADETATDSDGHTPGDLIDSSSDPAGRLRRLLTSAPAGRAWRRRGMVVMCRAFPDKMLVKGGKGRTGKARARGCAGRGRGGGNVLARVVELEVEVVFRTIVGFL